MNDSNQKNKITLDVRPTIQSGNDPFSEIMATVAKLGANEILEIINIFEPIPLINKLKTMGYKSWTEREDGGVVHTYFELEAESSPEELSASGKETDELNFAECLDKYQGKTTTVDVRHLEMPEPMVVILKELETLEEGYALFVEHKKMPQFLLPELKNRKYSIAFNKIDENHLQLLIFKAGQV